MFGAVDFGSVRFLFWLIPFIICNFFSRAVLYSAFVISGCSAKFEFSLHVLSCYCFFIIIFFSTLSVKIACSILTVFVSVFSVFICTVVEFEYMKRDATIRCAGTYQMWQLDQHEK